MRPEDLVLLPGDLSMARNHRDLQPDLAWLDRLPGTKVLSAGNHDLWWNNVATIRPMLRNSQLAVGGDAVATHGVIVCGTLGAPVPDEETPPECSHAAAWNRELQAWTGRSSTPRSFARGGNRCICSGIIPHSTDTGTRAPGLTASRPPASPRVSMGTSISRVSGPRPSRDGFEGSIINASPPTRSASAPFASTLGPDNEGVGGPGRSDRATTVFHRTTRLQQQRNRSYIGKIERASPPSQGWPARRPSSLRQEVLPMASMTPDDVRAAAEQLVQFHDRFAPLFGKEPGPGPRLRLPQGPDDLPRAQEHRADRPDVGHGDVSGLQKFINIAPWPYDDVQDEIQSLYELRSWRFWQSDEGVGPDSSGPRRGPAPSWPRTH